MLAALALFASVVCAAPTEIELVADINQRGAPASSDPEAGDPSMTFGTQSFVQVGALWFFVADTALNGRELWRTDGTPAGTALLRDIWPGPFGSSPTELMEHAGLLYFAATDDLRGRELWRSDGTEAGTVLVAELNPGPEGSFPQMLTSWNGALWFNALDAVHGSELWRSDGSASGTQLLLDLVPGALGSGPAFFQPAPGGGSLLFRASESQHGHELWATDGTAAGTALVIDLHPGPSSSLPYMLTEWNGSVYFRAFTPTHGEELWRTDGTAAGTRLVADLNPGVANSSPDLRFAVGYGGSLYFVANGGPGIGVELHKTDGTPAGSALVANLEPLTPGSFPTDFVVHGGALYFAARGADQSVAVGTELWRIPAPGQPVELAIDFRPGAASGLAAACGLVSFNGRLMLSADAGTGFELVATDGTPAGTVVLELAAGSSSSSPDTFTPLNATTLFFSADSSSAGRELHRTDGTPDGTAVLVDIAPGSEPMGSQPTRVMSPDGVALYFFADDGVHGREPWRWHPVQGATLVADIRPGSSGSEPSYPGFLWPGPGSIEAQHEVGFTTVWFGGAQRLVFSANDGVHGAEPWITDGTPGGTYMLGDQFPGPTGSNPDQFQFIAGHLHFAANDAPGSRTAFRSDGTAAGTQKFLAGASATQLSNPGLFERFRNEWWFRAHTPQLGVELWRTDGTPAGTQLALGAEFIPGAGSTGPQTFMWLGHLVALDDVLCFTAYSPGPGSQGVAPHQLYATDGTLLGTTLLTAATLGQGNLTPAGLVRLGDHLYFRASEAEHGAELWRSDGSAAGTELVVDLIPGPQSGAPAFFLPADDRLFFRAADAVDPAITDPTDVPDAWMTDGTVSGTVRVLDGGVKIFEALGWQRKVPAAGGVYFTANTALEWNELHFIDDGSDTAELVDSALPDTFSRNPSGLTLAQGALYFAGDDLLVGRELFRYAPAGASAQPIGHSGSGAELAWTMPQLGELSVASVRGAPASALAHLVYVSAPAAASPFPLFDPGSCMVLDPLSLQLVRVALVPDFSKAVPVPASPTVAGVTVHAQAFSVDLTPVLGVASSNGLALVLGE